MTYRYLIKRYLANVISIFYLIYLKKTLDLSKNIFSVFSYNPNCNCYSFLIVQTAFSNFSSLESSNNFLIFLGIFACGILPKRDF